MFESLGDACGQLCGASGGEGVVILSSVYVGTMGMGAVCTPLA